MSAVRSEAGEAVHPAVVRVSGLSRSRLAWLQATHGRAWAAVLWLCLAAAIALPLLLPLIGAVASESALTDTLLADGGLTVEQPVADVGAFNAFNRDMESRVAAGTAGTLVSLGAYATAGPLRVVTLNGSPAPAPLAGRQLSADYRDHLAAHVEVAAGELPPEGLGGGETAVTLPQAVADQLGLRLSDRLCVDLAGHGTPDWCARVVGLWLPVDSRDPYWNARPPAAELTVGRYDFFQLASLHPPGSQVAGVRFWANPAAVDSSQVETLQRQVALVSRELTTPQRHVSTRLASSLQQYEGRQRAAAALTHLLGAVVSLLGLLVVALVAGRFLDSQARELAVLRARGWPWTQTWRMAFTGLAALAASAAPVGLLLCVLLVAALSVGGTGISAATLHSGDFPGLGATVAAAVVALVVVLLVVAAGAGRRDAEATPGRLPSRPRRRPARALGMAALGALALGLPRLPEIQHALSAAPDPLPTALPLSQALGLVLLAAAVMPVLPLLGWVPRRRSSVARRLAGWQLERRPEQHAGAAFVLVLATAIAAFAGLGLATGLAGSELPALRAGLQAALVAGGLGALLLSLGGFGLHFRATAQRRLTEYGGLFAHGLPAGHVGRSLAAEQAAAARSSALAGCLLGVLFALAALPLGDPTPVTLGLGALGVAAAAFCLVLGAAAVGRLVRRQPARPELLQHPE